MTFSDAQRNEIIALVQQFGANRRGIVTSYQPQPPMAKVTLQPEGIETGWLPVLTQWVGNGWGMIAPLQAGDQVKLTCEEADGQNYAIAGRYYSEADAAPEGAGPGELWLVHETGATFALKADGSISLITATLNIEAPGGGNATVNLTGSLNVSVETTTAGKAFTPHTHPYVPGSGSETETGPPQG